MLRELRTGVRLRIWEDNKLSPAVVTSSNNTHSNRKSSKREEARTVSSSTWVEEEECSTHNNLRCGTFKLVVVGWSEVGWAEVVRPSSSLLPATPHNKQSADSTVEERDNTEAGAACSTSKLEEANKRMAGSLRSSSLADSK